MIVAKYIVQSHECNTNNTHHTHTHHAPSQHTQITSQTTSEIKGTHTTPVKHYVDDLSMAFTTTSTPKPNSCSVAVNKKLLKNLR